MMSAVLLDTNAFSMVLTDDPRLPSAARSAIQNARWAGLSVISLYEIGQKVRLGKWPEMAPFVGRLDVQAREDGFNLIPLSPAAALRASVMEWDHRDPFDRMIATVAQAENATVVSSDNAFDQIKQPRIWH